MSTIQHYNNNADRYLRQLKQTSSLPNTHPLSYLYFEAANRLMDQTQDRLVLDVGIGTGAASQLFLTAGYSVYGIDGSSRLLEICSDYGFASGNLKEFDLDSGPLPYKDNIFPLVISSCSLNYIKDSTRLVTEMLRITRPKGVLLFDCSTHTERDKNTIKTDKTTRDHPEKFIPNTDIFNRAIEEAGCNSKQVLHSIPFSLPYKGRDLPVKQHIIALIKK